MMHLRITQCTYWTPLNTMVKHCHQAVKTELVYVFVEEAKNKVSVVLSDSKV